MSSFKLSLMAMTTMFVFVALMSMQLIAASSIEGVAHANENHHINNCGTCGNICPLNTPECCSGKCMNTQNDSTNCGFCGNVCNDVPCTFGFCGYAC
ncbi:unnamed protein product [Sphagnum jensenii]|uniref:Uncharacterized protein n=1 Tax=Sphagnum jensenii TaxID=128206 RepID=A0ABP1AJQ3_9BRYO